MSESFTANSKVQVNNSIFQRAQIDYFKVCFICKVQEIPWETKASNIFNDINTNMEM